MMQQKTGWSVRNVLEEVRALVVTRGQEGSVIYTAEGERVIPCAAAQAIVDPTGCGDAYRAGLIHGLIHGLDWEVTGRIASLMGALKIEVRGTQNHSFSAVEFAARFFENFGMALPTAHAQGRFARAVSRVT
jgi:adenosine kinase